jgi:hypothetical protein
MNTYNLLNRYFNKKVTKYTLENKGLTMRSRAILHRPREIILIEATNIRWFSRHSGGGRLVLSNGGKEAQNYSSEVIKPEST